MRSYRAARYGLLILPALLAAGIAQTRPPAAHSAPAAAVPAPAALCWQVVPSPNTDNNLLQAVATVAANDVWAVGSTIEHWDGSAWQIVPSAAGYLYGVAAVAGNDVWAVGVGNGTLTEHWDGTSWMVVPSPSPGVRDNTLRGVVALAADNVWAVGGTTDANGTSSPLAEHWDGASWTVVPSPSPSGDLYSVSAVAPQDIWAVGFGNNTSGQQSFIEHWDGAAWAIAPNPNPSPFNNTLRGVVAVAGNEVWAVGSTYINTLTEHWNGTSWSVIPSPNVDSGSILYATAATAANDVWAVGYGAGRHQTLTEHWDGTSWTIFPSPNVSSFNSFYGIAALTANDLWAVGYYAGNTTNRQTLIEHYTTCPAATGTPTATPTGTLTPRTATPPGTATASGTSTITATGTATRTGTTTATATLTAGPPGSATATSTAPAGTATTTSTATATVTPCLTLNGSIDASDPTASRRLIRMGTGSTCAAPNPCPGNSGLGAFHYDSYLFTNSGTTAQCVTVVLTGGSSQTDEVQLAVYAGAFDPTSACMNYLADGSGSVGAGISTQAAFTVAPGANVVVVVDDPTSGAAGGAYTLGVSSCQFIPVIPTATTTSTAATATATQTTGPTTATPTATATALPATPTATPVPATPTTTAVPATATATAVPSTATATACAIRFSDVTDPAAYYYAGVYYLACRGVISGYDDGTFKPFNNTTRAQMTKIVTLAFNLALVTPPASGTFADVAPGSVFYPLIETAAARGIVSGYTCGGVDPQTGQSEPCDSARRPYFRPSDFVTRGQLTKIVVLGAGWALRTPPTPTFRDVPTGSVFYPFIETAVCHGVISGYSDGTFRPNNFAFRGQIAKIVYLAVTNPAGTCPVR